MTSYLVCVVTLAAFTTACGSAGDLCSEAAERLATCGVDVAEPEVCDDNSQAKAEAVLEQDCESLTSRTASFSPKPTTSCDANRNAWKVTKTTSWWTGKTKVKKEPAGRCCIHPATGKLVPPFTRRASMQCSTSGFWPDYNDDEVQDSSQWPLDSD